MTVDSDTRQAPGVPAPQEQSTGRGRILLMAGLAAGILFNALAIGSAGTLWSIPPGSSIRPMEQWFVIIVAAGLGVVVALPLSLAGMIRSRCATRSSRILGAIGVVLAMSPWLAGQLVWQYISVAHSLIMAE